MKIDSIAGSDTLGAPQGIGYTGAAGTIGAVAMTFLLSGDLRLAMRATRLLIEDGREHAAQSSEKQA